MGLAAYGKPRYLDKLIGPVLRLGEDGAFTLNQRFFDFCSPERHYAPALINHLGIPPRPPGGQMREEHQDLASSVQQALEIAVGKILVRLIRDYETRDFCFAGGVALNCTAYHGEQGLLAYQTATDRAEPQGYHQCATQAASRPPP